MHINIRPRWDFEKPDGARLHQSLLPLLQSIKQEGRLSAAAKLCNLSYRHAWNLLHEGSEFFGHSLVQMEKGRGARLTHLGETLVGSQQRIGARLQPELEGFASELNADLQSALSPDKSPLIRIYASHGYAVALMTQFARVEIHYHAPEHALIALNEGRCKLAGFHHPVATDIPEQSDLYRSLLDPERFGVIRFVYRQQGLMYHPDNPFEIHGIEDLGKPGVRFINRQSTSGSRRLLEHLLRHHAINPEEIIGFQNQEFTHSAVAAHIASGTADAGFGVEAAAHNFGLGFTPVIKEHYCWAYPREAEQDSDIQSFIQVISNADFQAKINELPGYQCDHSGQVVEAEWLFKKSG